MRNDIKPTHSEPDKHGNITSTHPAFSCVQITRQTGDRILFGSDVVHNQTVCIKISHAEVVRSCNTNYVHQVGKPIVEIVVSESQWASIVANATGKAIYSTLLHSIDTPGMIPGILVEKETDSFKHDMKRQVKEATSKIKDLTNELREALKQPTLKKKEIERITQEIEWANENLPSNVAFVHTVLDEHIEQKTSRMMTDVECYFNAKVTEFGMEAIANGTAGKNIVAIEQKD